MAGSDRRRLSVVVPVYGAPDELDNCLASLQQHTPSGTDVLVIDDASPDLPTREILQGWNDKVIDGWRFVANESNRGFVATANRGFRMTEGDVILLNSDTEVTPGWLQRLQRCLESDRRIASATPWTNNGEIASIPAFCAPNPVPPDPDAVAAVIAHTGAPCYPDIPTAVGFCMAISRRAINYVGHFDEDLFGKGYGEENDFSMRARQADMRNVLCDDAYVVHLGGRSFGPIGLMPDNSSMDRLLSRHPGYLAEVQSFIAADPLAPRRDALLHALERASVAMG